MVASRNPRHRRVSRIIKGTAGWVSFLGLFAVVGSLEQDTISVGTAVISLPVLGGLFIWSIEALRDDLK